MNIPECVHESWYDTPMFQEQVLLKIKTLLSSEQRFFCPINPKDIFKPFSIDKNKVKVILMGQDPYPNRFDAMGIAFAVHKGRPYPYSLRVLAKDCIRSQSVQELHEEYEKYFDSSLSNWIDQGVMLTNANLTCEENNPRSHDYIWLEFTMLFTKYMKETPFVFYGSLAKSFAINVNKYVATSHPAAEKHGVLFDGKWNEINQMLKEPIIWSIPF